MSIEAKIDALIAALDRNTAARSANISVTLPAGGSGGTIEAPKRVGRPTNAEKAAAQAAAQPAPSVAAPPPVSAPVQPVATPPSAAPAVTIQTIAKKVVDLAITRRDDVVALLAKYGAARASDLKPENFVAFDSEITALAAPKAVNPVSDLT